MENEIINLMNGNTIKMLVLVPVIFIFLDIASGYLKAIKNKNINSSISRDGYCKKLGWVVGLVLGLVFYFFLGSKLVIVGIATTCILTELTSILENLADVGVKIPLSQYFDKIK